MLSLLKKAIIKFNFFKYEKIKKYIFCRKYLSSFISIIIMEFEEK